MAKKTTEGPPKLERGGGKVPSALQNERITQQTRKQLGKHYANKYRTGRG